jgi:hypothetical protein
MFTFGRNIAMRPFGKSSGVEELSRMLYVL